MQVDEKKTGSGREHNSNLKSTENKRLETNLSPFALDMSFFGFDTALPRDRAGASNKGIFEHANPFSEVAKARKLQAFQDNDEEM